MFYEDRCDLYEKDATVIGSGRYAKVHDLGGIAVKRVCGVSEEYDSSMSQLRNEIEVYATCQHPNIVELLGWGEDFIMLTLMDGDLIKMSLHHKEAYKKYKNKAVLDVAKGLSLMHENEWAHMDLSQNNVLFKMQKGIPSFRICDMGFAMNQKRIDSGEYYPGTYVYMDLDAFMDMDNHKMETCYLTDIWSLGNLAGYMYTQGSFTHRLLLHKGLDRQGMRNFDRIVDIMKSIQQEDYDIITKREGMPKVVSSIMRINSSERPSLDEIIKRLSEET